MKLWTARAMAKKLGMADEEVLHTFWKLAEEHGLGTPVIGSDGNANITAYTYDDYKIAKAALDEQTRRRNAEIDRAGLPEPVRGRSNVWRKSTRKEKCSGA